MKLRVFFFLLQSMLVCDFKTVIHFSLLGKKCRICKSSRKIAIIFLIEKYTYVNSETRLLGFNSIIEEIMHIANEKLIN